MDSAPSSRGLAEVQGGARRCRSIESMGLRRGMWQKANTRRRGITRHVGLRKENIRLVSLTNGALITGGVHGGLRRRGWGKEFATGDFTPSGTGSRIPFRVLGFHAVYTEDLACKSVSRERAEAPALGIPAFHEPMIGVVCPGAAHAHKQQITKTIGKHHPHRAVEEGKRQSDGRRLIRSNQNA